jgi:hypothetical protein
MTINEAVELLAVLVASENNFLSNLSANELQALHMLIVKYDLLQSEIDRLIIALEKQVKRTAAGVDLVIENGKLKEEIERLKEENERLYTDLSFATQHL